MNIATYSVCLYNIFYLHQLSPDLFLMSLTYVIDGENIFWKEKSFIYMFDQHLQSVRYFMFSQKRNLS